MRPTDHDRALPGPAGRLADLFLGDLAVVRLVAVQEVIEGLHSTIVL
jgi:hypothetical protein